MFFGSYVAIITPFAFNGEVDKQALFQLVKWHVKQKTQGIVCLGTTGEAATLSFEERLEVVKTCLEAAENKIKVIVGTGTNNTLASVYFTRRMKYLGVDGCMAVVPYYNRPTQRGIVEHFRYIAAVGLPLIVYHHPGRTGVSVQPKTFSEIEKIENVVAIKEASGSVDVIREIQKYCSLPIFSGDDGLTVPIMKMGGVGVISVLANVVPFVCHQVVDLCANEKFTQAEELFSSYKELADALFLETNPQCVKYALHAMGKCLPHLRLPLIEPTEIDKKIIVRVMQKYFPNLSGDLPNYVNRLTTCE